MPIAILAFLKQFWLPITIGACALGLLGYIKVLHVEINHYKAQAVKYEQQIKEADEDRKQLEANASEISKKYHESLANQFAVTSKAKVATQKRIANDQETARIVLSPNAVSLFNSSKPEADKQESPGAEPADVGGTGTAEATLNQLLQISAENDANHRMCIATVHEWQHFWSDFTSSYGAVVNDSP